MSTEPSQWPEELALREQIVRVGRLMYERGLVVSTDGNVSARLDDEHFLCTPSGLCKGFMDPDQLIVVDVEGRKVGPATDATRNLGPTSEFVMHLEAYRQRAEVGGVVHAHPPLTVALSIAGISLADCMLPEVIVGLGLVQTTEYSTPSSPEGAEAIRPLIADHDGLILERHGTVTVGSDPWQAYLRLESIEQLARILLVLRQVENGEALPPQEVEKLLEQRRNLGLTRPGEEEEFRRICGVGTSPSTEEQPDPELVKTIARAVLEELEHSS
jgi:L-fuculose-phosphate aldolase